MIVFRIGTSSEEPRLPMDFSMVSFSKSSAFSSNSAFNSYHNKLTTLSFISDHYVYSKRSNIVETAFPSVRLSVCLSVHLCLCNALELWEYKWLFPRIYLYHVISHGSGLIMKKQPFSSGYCCVELGYEKSRFSTNISPNLGKDTRYGHSYNGRRIGTPMWSIEWYHFQLPWVIPQAYNVLQRQTTRKWYKVEQCLQWQSDRKSNMISRILPFSMTGNDP